MVMLILVIIIENIILIVVIKNHISFNDSDINSMNTDKSNILYQEYIKRDLVKYKDLQQLSYEIIEYIQNQNINIYDLLQLP
jgi:uncharacterized membrane protein